MSGLAKSVIPLLSAWENYTTEFPDGDLTGFAQWILASQGHPANPQPPAQPQKPIPAPTSGTGLDDTAQGAMLIARNHRILRLYSKPIIKDLGFTKDMEFSAVVHVAIMDHPNKKELCRELLIENSTGVEITRRLAQKGFISERPDPDDRRSALLSVTDKGRKILEQGYHRLSILHTSFLDALAASEKRQLVDMLHRINKFHTDQINNKPEILE